MVYTDSKSVGLNIVLVDTMGKKKHLVFGRLERRKEGNMACPKF